MLAATSLALSPAAGQAEDTPVVAAIEAAYLTKFPDFVTWPPAPVPEQSAEDLCVLAPDPVARLIEQAEAKLPTEARHAPVRRLHALGEATGCRVLFIGDSALDPAAAMPTPVPMLVVTDQAPAGHKGVINFVIQDDHVRFEIDDAEAGRRGIAISSKLLSLAVAVTPRT